MRLFITLSLLLSFLGSRAQTIHELSVQLTDNNSKVLEGAHVVWQSLNKPHSGGGLTNTEGNIRLEIPASCWTSDIVLQFSHLGFKTFNDTLVPSKSQEAPLRFVLEPAFYNLNEQVITGQYAAGSADQAVHKVTVVSREKIDNMAAITLEDVLTNSLNIRLSQDNILGSGLSMQGISGENVKIMIDGVPIVGRLDGNIDLSQINLNNVERIEIIEGPMSVNYGTNALAGTINIITKKDAVLKPSVGATTYFENTGTHNLQLQAQTRLLGTNIRMSGGRNYFDGWNATDNYWPSYQKTLADSGRFKQWKPKEQYFGRLNASRSYRSWLFNYRMEGFGETVLNRGMPRAPYGESAFDDTYYTSRMDHSLTAERSFERHQLRILAASNRYGRKKNTYVKDLTTLNQELTPNRADHDTSTFGLWMSRGTWSSQFNGPLNYQVGYDLNHETAQGERIASENSRMGDYALFGSVEWSPLKQLVLRPALRAAHNTVYNAPLSPSFNVKWAWKNSSIRGSYARGFRAPSLKELYFLFIDINHNIIGNTDLLAEQSNNYTLNFQHKQLLKNSLIKYSIGSYFNKIDNMITLAQINDVEYSYVNIGEFTSKGINASLQWVSNALNATISYNYLGRSNNIDEATVGAFNYTSEIAANVQWQLPKYGLRLSGFYKYQGKLQNFGINAANEVVETFIEPFHMSDITIAKSLFKNKLNLATGFKNLLNVQNVNASQMAGTHSGGASSISVGTGRTFFAQISFNVQ